jgi:hypothetical protein
MCIVIDTNRAADFNNPNDPYLVLLLDWLKRGGSVVTGGLLERELMKIAVMRGLLQEWSRRGNLRRISREDVEREEQTLPAIKSNDPHVVALTRLSRAKVVVTEDKELISDLKDASLMGTRRKIYKRDVNNPGNVRNHKRMLSGLDCP